MEFYCHENSCMAVLYQFFNDINISGDKIISTTPKPTDTCKYNEIYCYVVNHRRYMCLHNMYKCDGVLDCSDGADEDPTMCGEY